MWFPSYFIIYIAKIIKFNNKLISSVVTKQQCRVIVVVMHACEVYYERVCKRFGEVSR